MSAAKSSAFPSPLPLVKVCKLKPGDKIDFENDEGRFCPAVVQEKQGRYLKLRVHPNTTAWSNIDSESDRFAEFGSISQRKAHGFQNLKIGDRLEVNTNFVLTRFLEFLHPGWISCVTEAMSRTCGQILVRFQVSRSTRTWWVHLDNDKAIRKCIENNDKPSDLLADDEEKNACISSAEDQSRSQRKRKRSQENAHDHGEPLQKKQRLATSYTLHKQRLQLNEIFDEFVEKAEQEHIAQKKENDQLNAKMTVAQNDNKALRKRVKELEAMYEQYRAERNNLQRYDLVNVDALNESELSKLELKFHENIKHIKEAKSKLMECVACNDRQKNVVLVPCNHVDLCAACEAAMDNRICPRCRCAYTDTIELNM